MADLVYALGCVSGRWQLAVRYGDANKEPVYGRRRRTSDSSNAPRYASDRGAPGYGNTFNLGDLSPYARRASSP